VRSTEITRVCLVETKVGYVELRSLEAVSTWCRSHSRTQDSRIQDLLTFFLICRWMTQWLRSRSVVYITRMNLQKSSFQHSISSEDLNMSSFLRLPRELRDRVYDECFVAARPINLQKLAPLSKNSASQCLCLAPNFLASCRQVYEEGMIKLYGENLYFVDLTSSWRFSRSLCWLQCLGLHFEQQDKLYACFVNGPTFIT